MSRPREQSRGRSLRVQSRPRGSHSPFPQDLATEADIFIHPDESIAAELSLGGDLRDEEEIDLQEEDILRAQEDDATERIAERRWWRKPSPWWFICIIPFATIARAATQAPRVEIFIQLVCDAYKPIRAVDHGTFSSPASDRWKLCSSDPIIQAEVAKLSLAMAISTGVLGCLTTAWWGSLSDRHGRIKVLGWAISGLFIEQVIMVFVFKFSKFLPGGYWLLVVASTISGVTGGLNAVSATIHAYISDCTEPTARSRFFSLFLGLVFVGFAVGPTLGSMLIGATTDPISVFYAASFLYLIYVLVVCGVVPESLTASSMAESRKIYKESQGFISSTQVKFSPFAWFDWLFGFLRPLALLLPGGAREPDSGSRRRDWGLPLLAAAYGFGIALRGDITYEYQYMSLAFGWGSQQLGYFTSILSATRAIHLTLFLPLIAKLFQPKSGAQLPHGDNDPRRSDSDTSSSRTPSQVKFSPTSATPHVPTFDLTLARVSIFIEIIGFVLMASAPNGYLFTAYSVISSLGIGFSPAINSVASALYTQNGGKELGKLFGALGVVQTISSQVLGPFLYGVTYMKTVATVPTAIFIVSVVALTIAFLLLVPIRLQEPRISHVDDTENLGSRHRGLEDMSALEHTPLLGEQGTNRRGRR
ncbi:uncharacterized protein FIBRA_06914 [Fibroporia radiculosa]|uniref:Major facilitator superfamily (MFS) profile domain-containing protein n=1 Tax=Fibroporia radiculosa TaxID=599839 RepID=J4IBI6_9APHY|nr:uncharacterized protein FIBRA_06914 [Fibroporia radiculosa]CCM04726.1 predicted protein [Fibroporia radiculosa]